MFKEINCTHINNGEKTLHMYYAMPALQEEIEKRTSLIGKHRATENAPHLLDLISMTADEFYLLIPFIKAAMADVFDTLHAYSLDTPKTYEFHDSKFSENSLVVDAENNDEVEEDYPEVFEDGVHYYIYVHPFVNINLASPLDTAVFEALVNRIIYKWLVISYPDEAEIYNSMYLSASQSVADRCAMFRDKHLNITPRLV